MLNKIAESETSFSFHKSNMPQVTASLQLSHSLFIFYARYIHINFHITTLKLKLPISKHKHLSIRNYLFLFIFINKNSKANRLKIPHY